MLKDLKLVERLLMLFGCLTMLFFVAGYFVSLVFFYGFLASMAVLFLLWIGFWKCPHCGRNLWYNFDAPCRHCHQNIFEAPKEKLKNTGERSGFFGW